MGADLMMTALKGLPSDPQGADTDPLAPYRRVVEEATPKDIASALAWNLAGFYERLDDAETERFEDVLDYLSDGDNEAITEFASTPVLVAKAREHLIEAAQMICSRYVTVFTIGGFEVLLAGGMSWGDEPFEGFNSLQALSDLLDFTGHGISTPTPVWVLTVTGGGEVARPEMSLHSSEQRARDALYRRIAGTDRGRVPDDRDQVIEEYFRDHSFESFTIEEKPVDA
ncbi:hypothetical protein [Gordonia aichiensis]|uniref:hypothetical protein n=1 Tax=Gordonia aichiensis TaxID=36820 RepID=UPI003267D4A2